MRFLVRAAGSTWPATSWFLGRYVCLIGYYVISQWVWVLAIIAMMGQPMSAPHVSVGKNHPGSGAICDNRETPTTADRILSTNGRRETSYSDQMAPIGQCTTLTTSLVYLCQIGI